MAVAGFLFTGRHDRSHLMKKVEVIRPDVSLELAVDLVRKFYNIGTSKIEELVSYDDRNFLIKTEEGNKFVFKVLNSEESRSPKKLSFQNNILQNLLAAGLPVQKVIPSVHQRLVEHEMFYTHLNIRGEMGHRKHAFRLLKFIPGTVLCDNSVRIDAKLLYELGRSFARISHLLTRQFSEDEVPTLDNNWCVMQVSKLEEIVYAIPEESRKQMALEAIKRYEAELKPVADNLTQGIIHGDPNEQNILVCERSPRTTPPSFQIAGIIDWQDSHKCPVIAELAILCTYMILCHNSNWDPELDEDTLVRHCVEGFLTVWPLPEREIELLPTLVIGRFVQSLCIGAYTYYEVDNANEYLLDSAKKGWDILRRLLDRDQKEILRKWTG